MSCVAVSESGARAAEAEVEAGRVRDEVAVGDGEASEEEPSSVFSGWAGHARTLRRAGERRRAGFGEFAGRERRGDGYEFSGRISQDSVGQLDEALRRTSESRAHAR